MVPTELPPLSDGAEPASEVLPAPLLVALISTKFWPLLVGILDRAMGVCCVSGLALPYLLLEKNDVDCVGSFEALGALDVIEAVLDKPSDALLFLSSFSGCLADRKPNAPREAIVAAGFATHLYYWYRLRA